jgi:hypothetical protein
MSMHRPDCYCSMCGAKAFRSRLGAIPRVSGGSRLIHGLGQDDYSDDSVDVDNTDMTDATADEQPAYEEEPAPEEADTSTVDDTATEEESTDEETEETPEEAEASGISASDVANILSAGLTLTSSGIKTAAALGIIKKPASSQAAQAATVTPNAAAVMAVHTGKVTKVAPKSKLPLPLLIAGGVAVLLLLKRKK